MNEFITGNLNTLEEAARLLDDLGRNSEAEGLKAMHYELTSLVRTQGADSIVAHPGERVSMTWEQYVALTGKQQGADARPVAIDSDEFCKGYAEEWQATLKEQSDRIQELEADVAENDALIDSLREQLAARATPADHSELGPYEFDVKLGEQMYVDSSMQYRNGTVTLTIKRKPREKESKLIQVEPSLTRCAAASDGECFHSQCPQLKDGEPAKSGRHCPIDTWKDDD